MSSNTNDRIKVLADKLGVHHPMPLPPGAPSSVGMDYQTKIIWPSEPARWLQAIEEKLGITASGLFGERLKRCEDAARRSVILYSGRYTRGLVEGLPDHLFVFGDNASRVGNGGQAIIRGLPNTIGVATKKRGLRFMVSGDPIDMATIAVDLHHVEEEIRSGAYLNVVIPVHPDGRIALGDGLAELPQRAPELYAMLQAWLDRIKRTYPCKEQA